MTQVTRSTCLACTGPHLTSAENIPHVRETFLNIDRVLPHNTDLNTFKMVKIIQNMFFNYNGLNLGQ